MTNQQPNPSGTVLRSYMLQELIGEGGFGTIYRAYHAVVDREVAIKVIHSQYANQPDFIRRFETEARIVARLEHPFIIPLYDFWRDVSGAYLVMRLLRGGSLRQKLDNGTVFSLSGIIHIFEQVTAALALAHARGVIHRDIKPENILFDEADNAYLTDFGIAFDEAKYRDITFQNLSFGSPAYMSPEGIAKGKVTIRSDIYRLGILLYEIIMHDIPFQGNTTKQIFDEHINQPVPSVRGKRPDLPPALDAVIWRATAKQPEARFADALEVMEALRQLAPNQARTTAPKSMTIADKPTTQSRTVQISTLQFDPATKPANPYKGLRPFEEGDADDFFGREAVVTQMVEAIKTDRLLAIIGASGSGKSSLVRAGILPTLHKIGVIHTQNWFTLTITPSSQPYVQLAEALSRIATRPQTTLLNDLRADVTGFTTQLAEILFDESVQLLLFIDQFEELFTLVTDENERQQFLASLFHAITIPTSRLRVILTMRADYYDRPLNYVQFGGLMQQHTRVLLPLSEAEMKNAILRPAERAGLTIETGLTEAILDDVSQQPGAMPLLQYALADLVERNPGGALRMSDYTAMGGVAGALTSRANLLYATLTPDQQTVARRLFLRLVTVEDQNDTVYRRQVIWQDAIGDKREKDAVQNIIQVFADYRLLTLDHDPTTRTPTVEIGHDALLREWQLLKDWLRENRADLVVWQRLRTATHEWVQAGQDAGFLAQGTRLGEFERLASGADVRLNEQEGAYLHASSMARQRAQRRTQAVITALAVFSLVTLLLGIFAFDRAQQALQERDRANSEAQIAGSRELAAVAMIQQAQPDLALLLSLEALHAADTYEARNSLFNAFQAHPFLSSYLHGATDALRATALSVDQQVVIAVGRDNHIWRWNISTRQPLDALPTGFTDWINTLAINETWLIAGSDDGTIQLWDAQTSVALTEPVEAHPDGVWDIAIHPQQPEFLTVGVDGRVLRWTMPDTTSIPVSDTFASGDAVFYAVAYSPDGTVIAAAGEDNQIYLWEAASGELRATLSGHTNWVLTLVFSPDGHYLAAAGADGLISLWETATGNTLGQFQSGHSDWIRQLALSADGVVLASVSADNTIRLWNMTTGEFIRTLTGHTGEVWGVFFAPLDEGYRLISASADATAIIWDVKLPQPPGIDLRTTDGALGDLAISPNGEWLAVAEASNPDDNATNGLTIRSSVDFEPSFTLAGHVGPITDVAYHPAGAIVATSGADRSVRVWDSSTEALAYPALTGYAGVVTQVAFTLDGDTLIAVDDTGKIYLSDAKTGAPLDTKLMQHPGGVISLAVSSDGSQFATGGRDGSIRLWHVDDQTQSGDALVWHTDAVTAITFTTDQAYLISGSRDASIVVYDLAAGQIVAQVDRAHEDWITALSIAPDLSLLVTGARDGSIQLWNFPGLRRVGQPLAGHTDWITGVVFTPDGSRIITSGRDQRLISWTTRRSDWEQRACQIANRDLTQEEWQQYLAPRPYSATCSGRFNPESPQ